MGTASLCWTWRRRLTQAAATNAVQVRVLSRFRCHSSVATLPLPQTLKKQHRARSWHSR